MLWLLSPSTVQVGSVVTAISLMLSAVVPKFTWCFTAVDAPSHVSTALPLSASACMSPLAGMGSSATFVLSASLNTRALMLTVVVPYVTEASGVVTYDTTMVSPSATLNSTYDLPLAEAVVWRLVCSTPSNCLTPLT